MSMKRNPDGSYDVSSFDQFQDLDAAKPAPPFVPTFETNVVYRGVNGNNAVNEYYYASLETATALMLKFGAARLEGGPVDAAHPAPNGDVSAANPGPAGLDVMGDSGKPVLPRTLIFVAGTVIKNYVGVPIGRSKADFRVNAGNDLALHYIAEPEEKNPAFPMRIGAPPNDSTLHILSLAEQYCWKTLLAYALSGGPLDPV